MAEARLSVTLVPLESSRNEAINRDFPNYKEDFVRGEPGSILMGTAFWDKADSIYNMQVRPDDVWIVTFPKCGTTWAQEMAWLISTDCDFIGAKLPLELRSPFLEVSLLPGMNAPENEYIKRKLLKVEDLVHLPSPRLIKTHLPLRLLPPDLLDVAKVVYMARNPKDVITSYYYHHKLIKIQDCIISMEKFADYFMRDETVYGSFFNHVLEAWEKRDHANLHYMFYEDMKKDLLCEIQRLALFLDKSLTEKQVEALVEHLSFKNFKENPAVNTEVGKKMGYLNPSGHFMRKGECGDWKNHFSKTMNERVDQWIADNLANTDLTFLLQL